MLSYKEIVNAHCLLVCCLLCFANYSDNDCSAVYLTVT